MFLALLGLEGFSLATGVPSFSSREIIGFDLPDALREQTTVNGQTLDQCSVPKPTAEAVTPLRQAGTRSRSNARRRPS